MQNDDPSVATTYESWETEFLITLREGFRLDLQAAEEAKQPEAIEFCVDRIALVERILLERRTVKL